MELLGQQLETTDALAATNDLPDAIVTTSGLKITPLDAAVPEPAQALTIAWVKSVPAASSSSVIGPAV